MRVDRYQMEFNLVERWLTIHEEGKTIPQILKDREISTVALYGLGKLGKHVVREIKGSDVTISYVVDRVVSGIYDDILVKKPEDFLPKTDAIIVTVIYEFEEIEEMLSGKTESPIISLEEVLYEG